MHVSVIRSLIRRGQPAEIKIVYLSCSLRRRIKQMFHEIKQADVLVSMEYIKELEFLPARCLSLIV